MYGTYGHLLDDHLDDMVARLEALHAAENNVAPLPPGARSV